MSDLYPEVTIPGAEPEPPLSIIGLEFEMSGAAFDADGTPLDAAGNRLESKSTNSDNQE